MNEEAYRAILHRLGVDVGQRRPPDVEQRTAAFRRQFEAWIASARPGVPLFVLPQAPEPHAGHCVSCGGTAAEWRCAECVTALYIVLGFDKPEQDTPPSGQTTT